MTPHATVAASSREQPPRTAPTRHARIDRTVAEAVVGRRVKSNG